MKNYLLKQQARSEHGHACWDRPPMYLACLVSFWFFVVSTPLLGQRLLTVTGEAGTFIPASGRTPFWLKSNQYGIIPYSMPAATGRLSASLDYDSLRFITNRFAYGGAINAVTNIGVTTQWLLPESYVKFRYGAFEFYAGRRRELFGLADSTLSTGSYAWSGNALPVPKVQLEIRSFTPLKFTKGFVAVKGSYAHGWLGGRYVQHTMLHQKSLYVRLGKPDSKWKLYGGVNHQVVWGGYSDDLVKIGLVKRPYLPSGFKDYLNVVSGLKAEATGIVDSLAYTNFDLTNRIGNHVGSVDMAVELKTDRFIYYAYRQNPYETGAFFRGNSFADGLNGLRIRSTNPNAFIQQLLIEYLNTTNQGGDDFGKGKNGKVNYFNHAQFRDGWSYNGMGLGTPFITPAYSATGELPYGGFSNNNRVQVWHIGLAGTLVKPTRIWLDGPVTYQIKGSYSHNLGTYDAPFTSPLNQFSGIVSFQVPLSYWNGLLLNTSFGTDNGSLYTKGFGMYVGVRKEWISKLKR